MVNIQNQLNIPPIVCFLVLQRGMPWRHLQFCLNEEKTSWHTIYKWFTIWSKHNIFQISYEHLLHLYSNQRSLKAPINQFFTDTTFIKNIFGINCLGPSPVDRGRKATKLSVVCDNLGVVHSLTFHPGNKNDSCLLHHTLGAMKSSKLKHKSLCADKGYDTTRCRDFLRITGMHDCIMHKKLSNSSCKKRMIVENVFAWLDNSRRLIVRYDKKIQTYRSFTYLSLFLTLARRMESI